MRIGPDKSLRRTADFRQVYDSGQTHRSRDVVLVCLAKEAEVCRVGVIAGRRVGKAVRRNRAKRVLREAHRQIRRRRTIAGIDLVLIARTGAPDRTGPEILRQVEDLYSRAGLVSKTQGPHIDHSQ